MNVEHIPVLAKEVLEGLALSEGMIIVDGTCGLGGHTRLFAEAVGKTGLVYAFDKDERNLRIAKDRLSDFGDRIRFIHDSYARVADYVSSANAMLLDLGYSSAHVDDPTRGFSFQADGPLDMRYDIRGGVTAEDIVNSWSKDDLTTIFRRYGEEPRAPHIAKALFDARRKERITRTVQLADIISSVVRRTGKTHPATRVFQALRIVVNDEFGAVEEGIVQGISCLSSHGRLAVLSFHSLEDRIVKQLFLQAQDGVVLTKKPLIASREEQRDNPRSRSAKLRIFQKK